MTKTIQKQLNQQVAVASALKSSVAGCTPPNFVIERYNNINVSFDLENDTAWLTQPQIVDMFESSKSNVSEHITNIFNDEELDESAVVREIRIAGYNNGLGLPKQPIKHYNLDMIISLGFRINSKKAVQFRKWAIAKLKELLTTGKVELQPKVPQTYIEALEAHLAEVRAHEATKLELIETQGELSHKQVVIVELVDNLNLVQKRQVLNKVVRMGGNYQERWNALYSHFENVYHCNISLMAKRNNCSKLDYIDKHLNKLDKLFEIAAKLYETDVKKVKQDLFPDML